MRYFAPLNPGSMLAMSYDGAVVGVLEQKQIMCFLRSYIGRKYTAYFNFLEHFLARGFPRNIYNSNSSALCVTIMSPYEIVHYE